MRTSARRSYAHNVYISIKVNNNLKLFHTEVILRLLLRYFEVFWRAKEAEVISMLMAYILQTLDV